MGKTTEYNSLTENVEAVPGPVTEVVSSAKSRKGINSSAPKKRVKFKTGNEKTQAMDKNMEEASLSDKSKTAVIFPFTRHKITSMVMDSIMSIGKNDGASFSDIRKYMTDNYKANMELLDSSVKHHLKNCVEKGSLVTVKQITGEERFKKATNDLNLKGGINAQGRNLEKAPKPKSGNLKAKAARYPSIPEIHSRDQTAEGINMIENPEIMPGPSTKKVTETSNLDESSANAVSKKRTRRNDEKSLTENKRQKTTNAKVEKAEVVSAAESRNLESKVPHPKTAEMVMNAIKSLKKRNGANLEDIMKHMGDNYQVNLKVFKPHVSRFLNKSVEDGSLEKSGGANAEGRYKIKKLEKVKKASPKKSTKRKRV